MKKLEGLKVDALAVAVPTDVWDYKLTRKPIHEGSGIILVYHDHEDEDEPPRFIEIPEGGWSILGRADELSIDQISLLEYHWADYCKANGLTNELILIKA